MVRSDWSSDVCSSDLKHNETHTNMSLGSNGVGRVHSLRKIPKRLHGPNLCINCTSSTRLHRVLCSNETFQNAPKYYETHQNMSLGSNGVGRVHRCEKFQNDFMAQTCSLIAPVQPVLHRVSCSNETLPNAPKHYEMHQNMSLWTMGWIGSVHCEKF